MQILPKPTDSKATDRCHTATFYLFKKVEALIGEQGDGRRNEIRSLKRHSGN